MVTLTYFQMMHVADMICNQITDCTESSDIIGLCLEPSQFVSSVLIGVLKSGKAFLNFSAGSPGYVKQVLDHLHINLLLIQSSKLQVLEKLLYSYNAKLHHNRILSNLDMVLIKLTSLKEEGGNRTSLAYAITTSGTTGAPKIVRVPHRCIVPNIIYQREVFDLSVDDIVFLSSPLTFDPSIVEIFMTLSSGACLVITADDIKCRPRKLLQIMMKYHVTVLQCTPTLLQRFGAQLRSTLLGEKTPLRILALGGEKFPSLSQLLNWRAPGNSTKFYNLYGITEVSCWSSIYELSADDLKEKVLDIPLGEPMEDTEFVVKDDNGQLVSDGRGMFYIDSSKRICIIDDEEPLTKEQYVLRCTGDIVDVKIDGSVVYVGRGDYQIKRHGKRIDLSEIEQVLSKELSISSKAIYKEGILAVCLISDRPVDRSSVNTCIESYLPSHYYPDAMVTVADLPITKHGKCDIDRLWEMVSNSRTEHSVHADLEQYFTHAWKEVIHLEYPPSFDDLFIVSGGDSLKALNLTNQIQADIDVQLPWLLDFLLHRSFSDILNALKESLKAKNISEKNGTRMLEPLQLVDSIAEKILPEKEKDPKVNARKRKYNEEDNYNLLPDVKSKGILLDMVSNTNTSIKYRMKSISRCNRKYDWLIGIDSEVSEFYSDFDDLQGNSDSVIENNEEIYENSRDFTPLLSVKEEWKYDTRKCVDASPLIATLRDGRMVVYIGSHSHRFSAIVLHTGELLWEITLGDRIESSACMTLCGRFVVVGCYDYKLYAMDSLTGEIYWMYQTGGEVKSSPVVDPLTSLVIFGSHDQFLHAVNISKKEVVWCTDIDSGSVFASPCVSTEPHLVFCASLGGMVVALKGETGTLEWKYNCRKPVFSSPCVTHTGICVGCVDGYVYHIDYGGQLIWKFQTDGPVFSSPTSAGKKLFIGSHDSHMFCLNIDGSFCWKVKVESAVYSSAFTFTLKGMNDVLKSNISMCTDILKESTFSVDIPVSLISNSTQTSKRCESLNLSREDHLNVHPPIITKHNLHHFVTFASTNGELFIVEFNTGEIILKQKFSGEIFSSPVVYKNHIVVGCRNDYVYCLSLIT